MKNGMLTKKKSKKVLAFFFILPAAIGFGIAYGIDSLVNLTNPASYNSKIQTLSDLDLHYACFSVFLFSRLVAWINNYPGIYKSRIMLRNSGNLRANMFIYKQVGGQPGPIVMETEGDVGKYNRANRSMNHFMENLGGMLLCFPLAAFCFPLPSMLLMIVFALGRVLHQTGYTNKGYGGHGLGFGFSQLGSLTVDGLVLLAGIKAALL